MSHAIYKYQLAVLEKQEIELPKDARIIRVDSVGGLFWLWAVVNTDIKCPKEIRYLECYKTGQPIENPETLNYLGLCTLWVMMELGLYFFERFQPTISPLGET